MSTSLKHAATQRIGFVPERVSHQLRLRACTLLWFHPIADTQRAQNQLICV
jgi:hypothetical protein